MTATRTDTAPVLPRSRAGGAGGLARRERQGGADVDGALLSTLTVRALLERLAGTEEQLTRVRLQQIELPPSALRSLLREQREIIKELRARD